MAVKIRLQRHGKKNFAFFHIVVADARAPRDGRFIEQLGSYNPNTNPGTTVRPSATPHGHRPRQRVSSQRETPHSVQAALFPRATHGKTFDVHGQMLG